MKISIVTTTWNSASTVSDTLESVLNQEYNNVEYIVVDGLSTDNTIDIVRSYEKKFKDAGKEFRFISEKDQGIYDAMNKGLKMAAGEVIAILNSDDFFTSTFVLSRVAECFEDGVDAIYGDIHFVKDENLKKCTRYYSSRYFHPWLLHFGFMPAHASFYCRKEIFEKYGYYDLQYRTSSDFEMMVRLFHKYGINAKYVNMDFVTMRVGGASTANMQAKRNVQNDIDRALIQHGIYSNFLYKYVRYFWRIGELIYTYIKFN